jgi:hypothetical protein
MVELIPRQVLFGNPERLSPRISPDGTRLAWIAPHEGVLNVWVAPTTPQAGVDWDQAQVVTDDTDRGIRMFAWAHDGRHLLYLKDTGGDENFRLHDVDTQTMQRRDLTPFDGVQARLIAMERKFPTEVLVALNKDNPQLHDVYRLDLVTGELTKEVANPGFIGWIADAQMAVRGAADHPLRRRADQRRDRVQRGRHHAADDQLGRGQHRPAGPHRRRHRRGRSAGRRPRSGRERRPGAPGYPGAADRDIREGPVGVPGPRPVGG